MATVGWIVLVVITAALGVLGARRWYLWVARQDDDTYFDRQWP